MNLSIKLPDYAEQFVKRVGMATDVLRNGPTDISRAMFRKSLDCLVSTQYTSNTARGVTASIQYSTLVAAYKSWVYIAANKIAQSVAALPLQLYVYRNAKTGKLIKGTEFKRVLKSKGDTGKQHYYMKQVGIEREEIYDHPFLDLMARPNGIDTRSTLWQSIILKLELQGSCGLYMPKTVFGTPAELWPLPLTRTATLKPIPDCRLVIDGFIYEDGSLKQRFEMNEIAWIRYPDPGTPYEGMSALKAQTYPYDIDNYIQQMQYFMFKNKAVPGLILSSDKKMNQTQIDELVAEINGQWGGATRAGKPMILHSGLKEAGKLTPAFSDLATGDVAQENQDKLLSAYGVPAGKIGLVKDVNRANMEALDKTFNNETLKPRIMIIEEIFERDILPLYDENLTLDFIIPSNTDRKLDIQERSMNLKYFYTSVNEEREKEGKEPAEWGETPWQPINQVQYGEGEEPVAKDADSHHTAHLTPPYSLGETKAYWTEERKTVTWKVFTKAIEGYEKLFGEIMRKTFKRQLDEILKKLEGAPGKRLGGEIRGWSLTRVKQYVKAKDATARFNIKKGEEAEKLQKTTEPVYVDIAEESGSARMGQLSGIKAVDIDFVFEVDDSMLEWIGIRSDAFSKQVTGTTFDEVKSILTSGFAEGAPVSEIAGTLREKFASWEKYRADLISRTEVVGTHNWADLEAVKQSGVEKKLKKIWISSRDATVRETHQLAESTYSDGIKINKLFSVGDDSMEAPGMGSVAAENVNCRCTIGYVKSK